MCRPSPLPLVAKHAHCCSRVETCSALELMLACLERQCTPFFPRHEATRHVLLPSLPVLTQLDVLDVEYKTAAALVPGTLLVPLLIQAGTTATKEQIAIFEVSSSIRVCVYGVPAAVVKSTTWCNTTPDTKKESTRVTAHVGEKK